MFFTLYINICIGFNKNYIIHVGLLFSCSFSFELNKIYIILSANLKVKKTIT